MRAAIYATPAPGSDLARLAGLWLGRDAFTGVATRPSDPVHDPVVAEPARYGFHATLRAPFRPNHDGSLDALSGRLADFCGTRPAPVIRNLTLAQLGTFLALVPGEPEPTLHALEAEVLDAFEPFRAPLDGDEIARRRPDRLSERQREHLERWGYPFVLDEYRFHMTLTGSLPGPTDAIHRDLERHFAPVLGRPLAVDGLGLFVEPAPGEAFRVHAFHPFGPAAVPPPAEQP